MRLLPSLAIFFLLLTHLSSCAPAPTQYLFVMQAKEATIAATADGFQITLKDVDPQTIQFADRPARKASVISTAAFMNDWLYKSSTFQRDPPNAAIVFGDQVDSSGNSAAVAVELKKPQSSGLSSWTFQLKDLEGKLVPGTYYKINLFIDAANCTGVFGQNHC